MVKTIRPKRPLSVSWFCYVVLMFAVISLARLAQTLKDWEYLKGLLPIPPEYLAVTGLVWGVVGLMAAWQLWQGSAWASGFALVYVILNSISYWIDRLFLPGHPERNINWPFAAVVNVLFIAWGAWILTRQKARQFFEETNERRLKNKTPP